MRIAKYLLLLILFPISGCELISFNNYATDMFDRIYGISDRPPVYLDEKTQNLINDKFIIWLNDDLVDQALIINDRD
ncbi:hypothetical protein A8L45_03330 [Veronia pacifica]|uniref:Uncharacterized protein n=1 Tax=Veronia pacifica TaxID=1080227 RepID=A0A1C3ER29_9GAMM|nr:hypothetical protein A8L45_03330 [Veronia pacifica]